MPLRESYLSAIQHSKLEYEPDVILGVVRKTPPWFRSAIDENLSQLAPSSDLLDELQTRKTSLEEEKNELSEEEIHNRAWQRIQFGKQYLEELDSREAEEFYHQQARLRQYHNSEEETAVIICYEKLPKLCHRHLLLSRVQATPPEPTEMGDGEDDSGDSP